MTPAAGISTGTIVLIGGVIVIAGAIYYLKSTSRIKTKESSVTNILTKENRKKGYKSVIEDAIKEEDWETLEDMLNSRASDFPDLLKMIKKALENK